MVKHILVGDQELYIITGRFRKKLYLISGSAAFEVEKVVPRG